MGSLLLPILEGSLLSVSSPILPSGLEKETILQRTLACIRLFFAMASIRHADCVPSLHNYLSAWNGRQHCRYRFSKLRHVKYK